MMTEECVERFCGYNINFDLVEDGVHSKDLKMQWKAGEIELE